MSKKNHDKRELISLLFHSAEFNSRDKDSAREFLQSEGVNTDKLVHEGLKRIKRMQLLANAEKTKKEMALSESVQSAATEWVDKLLNEMNFSLSALVQSEQLSISFRNIENLSKEDLRKILIRHYTLKILNQQKDENEI